MKKILCKLSMAIFLFCSLIPMAQAKEAIDQIVAIVNDDVITDTELDQAVQVVAMQLSQSKAAEKPSQSVLKKQVLDQLINKRLQLQAAKQSGINVTDSDMDKAIAGIAKQNNITTEALYQQLGHEGMNAKDYRKEIHDQLIMQKLQQQEIVSHITVSTQEIDDFLKSKAWQNNGTKQYHIEDILIPLSEKPSTGELTRAEQQAKVIMSKLEANKPLKQAADEASLDSKMLRSSDLGWRKLTEIPTAFVDKITHMKSNRVAGPIQTGNGMHILRLVKTRSAGGEAKPNRKQAEQYLLHHKFEEAMQEWVSKLRSSAFITTPDTDNARKYA